MKKFLLLWLCLIITACGPATVVPTPDEPQEVEAATGDTPTPENTSPAITDVIEGTATGVAGTPEKADTPITDSAPAELLNQVLFGQTGGMKALGQIKESKDTQFVAGLIDTMRYRRDLDDEVAFTLNTLTGQNLGPDWFEWVEWAGNHPEIESFDGYVAWKANLFSQIDPNFLRFVYPEVKVDPDSRVEEIVWGGVRVDGIPALDNPTMIDPEEANYLVSEERVFGVSINGDTRAYPARFLDWHEMFNDVVGGEPVSLAY